MSKKVLCTKSLLTTSDLTLTQLYAWLPFMPLLVPRDISYISTQSQQQIFIVPWVHGKCK